ncbi:hypothetical protein BK026_17780 [Alteromonas sp. V450]|uniref:hypothetical protein n=1 Tax=Alteromonas sp. V450 TaxID=1912139 RepID=UPI0008FF09EF|nr:hypothetical protein [Alteromonas sp. V450]OJF70471.1 hypothetical protein BK026_17780 [Alteromonas sp. V450]
MSASLLQIVQTVYHGISLSVFWKDSDNAYQFYMDGKERGARLFDASVSSSFSFAVKDSQFVLKVTPSSKKGVDIIGFYKSGLPYKLSAFRSSDKMLVSVSESA